MQAVSLEGHYGQPTDVDVCSHCHVVWFDAFESVKLSGLGWVSLLRTMIASPALSQPLQPALECLRCSEPLKPVRNLTRFGRTAALECTHGHGHLQSFSLLLAERGLVRPLNPQDRHTLLAQNRHLSCLNCGADLLGKEEVCRFCTSPWLMVDVPRLAAALLNRHGDPLPTEAAQHLSFACIGCGHPTEPTQDLRCPQCDQSVSVPNLQLLNPLLDSIEPILRGRMPRQAGPWGEKLKRQQGDHQATLLHRVMHHLRDGEYTPGDWSAERILNWVFYAALAAFLFWIFRSTN